ncbi:unnamed protein product [Parascedosporium putredinis]|uniref:Man1/Src1-like C-terminal domain-containing protein n=1 Tax=Parascedosporium putredinis TaxID=1442378 RepID=A0A9P1H686_9PEZI|nr:unnamed protein product [Parascedosporium putredinis]CAI7997783.1 unnamed protein product [Parascedosporium putredinis]
MADYDGFEYLQEDFQPESLTPILVDLFNDQIVPQRKKILARAARAKRSSSGIVNAGTEDMFDLEPPKSTRRSRSPRKSTNPVKSEDFDEPTLPAYSSRSSRSVSRQLAQTSDTDTVPDTIRSSRRTVTPRIKSEEPEGHRFGRLSTDHVSAEQSVFTSDNPFQSGSSPVPAKTPNGRRSRTPKSTSRRQTNGVFSASEDDTQTGISYNKVASRSVRRQISEPPELEPGEEFTPEAQLELQQEWASQGKSAVVTRRKAAAPARKSMLVTSLWVLFTALLAAYAAWYRQEKLAIGYCGLGRPATQIIPRSSRTRMGLIEELRERRAQFECSESITETGEKLETPTIEVEELKETVSRKRNKRLNKQDFDDLWVAALGEVQGREEVEVKEKTGAGGIPNTYLSSSSLARVPLTCAIKRSVINGLERHRITIGSLIGTLLLAIYARSRYLSERAIAAKVPALVDLVLDRLHKQKDLAEDVLEDPWLFLPNLRDDVLRSVHSLPARERLWQRVRAVVEQNSNVRTGQRENSNGEFGRAWEGDETPEASDRKHAKWDESRPIY